MRLNAALAALVLVATTQIAIAADAAPGAITLAGHKAGYILTLDSARGGDIISAKGTMGYEVADVCEGWAVRQHLSMTLTNADGQDVDLVSDYTTLESKDGLRLHFRMRQATDGAITSQTEGSASLGRTGGPGEARYVQPKGTKAALPAGTLFPMAHTVSILSAARDGRKFLSLPLFDGTGDKGVEDSSVVVLDWKKGAKTDYPDLASLASTRVRLAFFDRKSGNLTPSYEVGMRYWENGVSDDLQMDFGEFVMRAKMREFTLLPPKC